PKAAKNPVEVQGARAAQRRDGAAMARFLAWLAGEAPKGRLTERDAAARIDALRAEDPLFVEPSFATVSAAGPHSALPHYRPSPATDRPIRPGELYLTDSGGQYLDGTTDVTRTIAVGTPSTEMRDRFTRVLRAHIALATARFPEGTRGGHLDGIARRPLWEAGLDFGHGTGHGVGSYLNVHEGPQSISTASASAPFSAGVIISNEPGYYQDGAFGIRIENLLVAVPVLPASEDGRRFLAFETLTAVPIDLALVEASLLAADEIAWLDRYHAFVREAILPLLQGQEADWLLGATRPLAP
ncbi:MAG: M24B family metallopeptidase, partial [Geminicoccaceae bacterium]